MKDRDKEDIIFLKRHNIIQKYILLPFLKIEKQNRQEIVKFIKKLKKPTFPKKIKNFYVNL